MNIRWMVLFAVVAEEASFTRAALRLNIAQPWLSAQLRKLELELGIQLLERNSSGVEVTNEGRALLPHAQAVAESSRAFRELARTMGDIRTKTVRIGSHLPLLDINRLGLVNEEFARKYPHYSIVAHTGDADELLQQLQAGQLDFAIVPSPISEDEEALESLPIGPLNPYLLAPRSLAASDWTSAADSRTVAVPPQSAHPALLSDLLESLKEAGASTRPAPELDRRAMEHLARTHVQPVLMLGGAAEDYKDSRDLEAFPLPVAQVSNLLLRSTRNAVARAAERYWSTASARAIDVAPALTAEKADW